MIENTPLSLHDLTQLIEATRPHFDALIKRGEKNEGLMRADNWNDEEKADFKAQDREVYSMGITAHKINTVCAEQRKSRSGWQVEAVSDVNDEIKAELATMRMRDIESRNNFKYTESDVFFSGVGVILGAIAIDMKPDERGNMTVKLREVDYRNVFFDKNSREYERNDGVFAGEVREMYRKDVIAEYGEDAAKNLSSGQMFWSNNNKLSYWIKPNKSGNADLDIITLYDLYYKTIRNVWVVTVEGEKVLETEDREEAEDIGRKYMLPYLERLEEEPLVDVQEVPQTRFDKYCFALSDILSYEKTDSPYHPYSYYQAFAFKDKIWSLTCLLKDPQRFLDRIVAQIDYSFGVDLKNVYEVVMNQVADGLTIEQVMERIKNNEFIPVHSKGSINPIPSQGANPQWIQTLGIFQGLIQDIGGGRSFSGLADEPGESGIAIQQKKMQGELVAMLFVDNLLRWKRDLGNKILWHLKQYDTKPYVIKVHGGSLSEEMIQMLEQEQIFIPSKTKAGTGYLKLNQGSPMSYLYDADLELTITESELSETQRQSRFAELMLYAKIFGAPPAEVWLENSPLSYTMKQKMIQYYKEQQQAIMQQQQEEANLEKAKVLVSDKGQVIGAATQLQRAQQPTNGKTNTPKKKATKK